MGPYQLDVVFDEPFLSLFDVGRRFGFFGLVDLVGRLFEARQEFFQRFED